MDAVIHMSALRPTQPGTVPHSAVSIAFESALSHSSDMNAKIERNTRVDIDDKQGSMSLQ